MGRGRGGIVVMWAAAAAGCLEYSPHAHRLEPSEEALNFEAIARLEATPAPEPLRFAVLGDTQLALDEAEAAVESLNRRADLSFVVQIGDLTHFGLLREFRLANDLLARLRVPYLVVIGIHDYLGNGETIFDHMFGGRNLAFTWGRTRFVLLDSNSREFGFRGAVPDLAWLAAQLAPDGSADRAVLFSHIAPVSGDFDPALVEPYLALLRGAAPTLSFHGHEHRYEERVVDGVPLYLADSADGRSYLVATLLPDGAFEVVRVGF